MKKLFVFLLVFTSFAIAGEPQWETDLQVAQKLAAKGDRAILVNFSGSDWCGWCKKLDREVFRNEKFLDFADKELVLVQIDFPRYKKLSSELRKANEGLAKEYGVQGFPTVLLLDANKKVLLRTGFQPGGASSYVDHLKASMN